MSRQPSIAPTASRSLTALKVVICAALVFAESGAEAGTATSNLTVSASIANNCTITTGTLAFGAYDPITTHATTDATASLAFTLTCTAGATTSIDLGQGSNAAAGSTATVPLRQMASGANRLAYFLYTNAGLSTVWGSGAATRSYTGTGAADSSVVCYGKVPQAQNKPAGSYTDTVVATINF